MAAQRESIKIYIPHPNQPELSICGVLEQYTPGIETKGRKLALILHGTMGHKDYLFQRRLAHRLLMDSFRFDFRGNHETGGTWKQGALEEDLEDLNAVVAYLKSKYSYEIELVVGHSRGSLVGFRWISTTETGRKVPAFINVSGRYRMRVSISRHVKARYSAMLRKCHSLTIFVSTSPFVVSWVAMGDNHPTLQFRQILIEQLHLCLSRKKILESAGAQRWSESFTKQGYYEWHVTVARKPIVAMIYPHDVEKFCAWDTSIIWAQFPKETDVLTLHGLADKTVPPYDALIYAKALGNRMPGTHSLYLMEDADHNFNKRQDDVVDVILQWWEARQRGELTTGIWLSDIKRHNPVKL